MELTCRIVPIESQKTLADLEPGVVAETEHGIRWRDDNGIVFTLKKGYPIAMNVGNRVSPKAKEYKITGRVFGKIEIVFEI